jgi:hypothetical protein
MAAKTTGRAIIVEMSHDWARRKLTLAWFDWCAERRERRSENQDWGDVQTRAVLANDVACLRWLGPPDDNATRSHVRPSVRPSVRPRDRLMRRQEADVAPWSFLATVRGAERDVSREARDLAARLRSCGRLSMSSLSGDGCATLTGSSAGVALPAIARCVNASMLGTCWLLCESPDGIHELIAARLSHLSEIWPPLHSICDLRRDQPAVEHRQMWRSYHRQPVDGRVEAGASAALVDGLRSTFDAAELELALVKPFDGDRLAAEIVLANPPALPHAWTSLRACIQSADELACVLGYSITPRRMLARGLSAGRSRGLSRLTRTPALPAGHSSPLS